MNDISPGLYIVPTPIGNLSDFSSRSSEILQHADIIACEDTRTTGKLLKLLNISYSKLISYHDHNEKKMADKLIDRILEGQSVALVSDAGTPTISDPGYRLVNGAIKSGCDIISVPGPTALIAALAASGLAVHNFIFAGFPPQKKGRKSFLDEHCNHKYTTIFYESPYRIKKLINEIKERSDKNRQTCICREISKIHEEYIRGGVEEISEILENRDIKGEIVLIIEGK